MKELQLVELRKDREFGELISDLILFYKQNFKALFSLFVRYGIVIMAVGAVAGVLIERFSPQTVSGMEFSPFAFFGVLAFLPFLLFAMYATMAATFAYIQGYAEVGKEGALDFAKQNFWRVVGRLFVLFLAAIGIGIAVFGVLGLMVFGMFRLTPWLGVIFYLAFLFFVVYISIKIILWGYIYTTGNMSVIDALKESWDLTYGRWWWTFGVYFVISMMGSIVMYIFMIPIYLLTMVPIIMGGDMASTSGGGNMAIISMFVMFAGYMLYGMLMYTLIPLIYYSLHERKYGTGIADRIDAVEQKRDSLFENEGDV